MKILMLDLDGVLNNKQFLLANKEEIKGAHNPYEADLNFMQHSLDPRNMWCLKYILDNVPDLKIVISSAWRTHYNIESFQEVFKGFGIDPKSIIDKTPKRLSSVRCEEIGMWLTDAGFIVESWIALDDHEIYNLDDPRKQQEVLTDSWNGLTMPDTFKVIKAFKSDFCAPELYI